MFRMLNSRYYCIRISQNSFRVLDYVLHRMYTQLHTLFRTGHFSDWGHSYILYVSTPVRYMAGIGNAYHMNHDAMIHAGH